MEVAIYHWECHQIRENQPAYDINELSTDKNEKRERKHLRNTTVGTNYKSKQNSHH